MTSSDREARLADVFVALADALRPEHDVIDTLDTLVQAATRFTAAVDAGIVLADADGALHVMASTSERAAELEEEQLGTTEGPCLEAFHGGAVVESTDLAETDRWPGFTRTALERGFRAVHATPLRHRDRTLGAINLFAKEPGPFSDNDIAVVQALADVATLGLVFSETLREQNDIAAQLQRALNSRVVIEQAKGVLAERQNISVDKAFTLLRAHARRTGAKLRDVAHGVVSTTTTL
ncbi:GAF and ANTAR domain-containing protein [Rathayibacter sp. ZW T2_19]|uniref:GAF and ANTAR domain-containing protein n=1 Tax=Rathayibacter rubneri TaxID=2950106 RepID=A0A9X2E1E7_9MICO|nr:GAF and ANTAR domain-containing protein [Rathayibacter rubneri]MCM6764121.1 GAF and ANTAR domain-containing protein [Rathayibacter rubneri]